MGTTMIDNTNKPTIPECIEVRRTVIVPARGGSKRLPGKNKINFMGKPLVMHTIDVLVESGCFDTIIFTSDDESLEALITPEHVKNGVIFSRRPDELATDTAKALQVVEYYHEQDSEFHLNQIWLCLPTCPLRSVEDVRAATSMLVNGIDSVVSVTNYEFPPTLSLVEEAGRLIENNPTMPFATGNTRSQDHDIGLRPNGALYGSWKRSFERNRNFFNGSVVPYFMPRSRSADIDTELDLRIAEVLYNHMNPNNG